jgi:tubulin polyglutamylase TTLL4
MNQF